MCNTHFWNNVQYALQLYRGGQFYWWIVVCSFVLFCFGHCIAFPFNILAIALLTRRFTESDYPYVIFKFILCIQNLSYSFYFFLLHMLYCLSILCCFVVFFLSLLLQSFYLHQSYRSFPSHQSLSMSQTIH